MLGLLALAILHRGFAKSCLSLATTSLVAVAVRAISGTERKCVGSFFMYSNAGLQDRRGTL